MDTAGDPLGALPLFPPIRFGDGKKGPGALLSRGLGLLGGLGALFRYVIDERRMARRGEGVPPGATVPIDGRGLFVVVMDHWVDVYRDAHKPKERLLRAARAGSSVATDTAGFGDRETCLLTLVLSGGEVVIGQTPGDGFRRSIDRFVAAFPTVGPTPS